MSGLAGMFTGMIKKHIRSGTEQAIESIKKKAENSLLINIALDIVTYILVAILIGVSATWIVLIKSMLKTFHESPFLDKFMKKEHANPKVSIILPARNEEKFIERCLDSLLEQDYTNYEIVVINDSSNDSTGSIIKKYSEKFPIVIFVDAKP